MILLEPKIYLQKIFGQIALATILVFAFTQETFGKSDELEEFPEVDLRCAFADRFGGTKFEVGSFCSLQDNAFVSARTLAAKAVKENSKSFRAYYLLGASVHFGDGNLPKALHTLEKSRELLEKIHKSAIDEDHKDYFAAFSLFQELMEVHGEMDHYAERIEYADLIEERFSMDMQASKAWPLMKLGRFDEARVVAKAGIRSDDLWAQKVASTSLCAIESELRKRYEAYAACMAAAKPYRKTNRNGAVELTNAGAAAEEILRFDEAERLYLEAALRPMSSSANPWGRLAYLYLGQARYAEALEAWKRMQEARAARSMVHLNQQDQSEADLIGATLLLIVGRSEQADSVVSRVVERPDRQGTTSAHSDQIRAGNQIVARIIYLDEAHLYEEQAAVESSFYQAMRLRSRAAWKRMQAWYVGRQAAKVLSQKERLVTTLRPRVPGALEIQPWMAPEIVGLVGAGVANQALVYARKEEILPYSQAEVVFKAHETDIAYLQGDYAHAREAAKLVLSKGTKAFDLLIARACALGAVSSWRLGDLGSATKLYQAALSRDPLILRRLGLSLPVELVGVGSDAKNAVHKLTRFPRFELSDRGFILKVSSTNASLRARDGSVVLSVVFDTQKWNESKLDNATLIAQEIQSNLFSPLVDFTQKDLHTLEGSVGSGVRGKDVLDQILKPDGS